MEENVLSKKERKALKRAEKEQKREQEKKKKQIKKWGKWLFVLLIVAGIIAAIVVLVQPKSLGTDFSQSMPYEGATHISEGTKADYESNPPTSGNHWPQPLRDGIYETEKPDEAIVHSMEHGRVWISYKPSLPEGIKQELTNLVKSQSLVILTPRSANETDIALAAWTRLDKFNLSDGILDAKRILDFINRYRNKGPEQVVGVQGSRTYEEY